jgi:hypothetical protein
MESRKFWFKNPLIIASLACVTAFAVACGDDDDSAGPTPSGGSKNTAGSGGSSTAGKTGGGGTNSVAGKTGNESGSGTTEGGAGAGAGGAGAGAGGEAGGGPVDCTDEDDKGCYSCKPKKFDQYLNHCPTTGSEDFDNSQLTSLNKVPAP